MNIQRIAVIGAGTMGHAIAGQGARSGFIVTLNDVDAERLDAGRASIAAAFDKAVAKGKMAADDIPGALDQLTFDAHLKSAVSRADLVIEAVTESVPLKARIFRAVEAAAPADAILATNTSCLSVTEIAAAVSRPQRVLGMHFFNPVAVMPLLELVLGEHTAGPTVAAARTVGERLGKTCIEVRDSPGFATSRLGIALGNEAMRMLQEGVARAEDIDRAMVLGYRHPIGPLALSDRVGLDVRLAITEHLYRELGADTFRPPQILKRMVRAGLLGRKSGQGFYRYD